MKNVGVLEEDMLFMHVCAPPEPVLRERLRKRGDSPEAIEKRIRDSQDWDIHARSLTVPITFIENNDSLESFRKTVTDLVS